MGRGFQHGRWNGLMGELVEKRTDMVLSALKVSAEREAVADFTVPFLESGIAILVAKRTGIISPTAFLGKSPPVKNGALLEVQHIDFNF